MNLTKDQAAILAFVLEHVRADDEIETLNFRLSGEFDASFHAAVLGIGVDENEKPISLVVSLPLHGRGVFMALTGSNSAEVARLLANLEDYERDTGRTLRALETVMTEGPDPYKALLLLHTVSHPQLADIPDSAAIHSMERNFLVIMGIDEMEYSCKTQNGVVAMLDLLQASERSLLVFA